MFGLSQAVLGIVATYGLLGLLLILLSFDSRLRLGYKLGAIVLVASAIGASYWTITAWLGWAVTAPLPPRFQVIAVHVVEPDKSAGTPGTAYYWVQQIGNDNQPVAAPRAYAVPLTAATAEDSQVAKDLLQDGEEVLGEAKAATGEAASESEGEAAEERSAEPEGETSNPFAGFGGPLGEPARIDFTQMPSFELPAKAP